MIRRSFFSAVILSLSFFAAKGQSAHSFLRQADKNYKNENYQAAEENYRRAIEKKQDEKTNYNLGNAIYQQGRYDEAATKYENAAAANADKELKAKAFYNMGNALFQNKKTEESIAAYKKALLLNPNDLQTKRNLALAKRTLTQMQQQQQQQQKQEQDKQEEQQKNEEQQQQTQQQNQQKESQETREQPQDLNKKEAEKLLEVMDREEQKVQEKLKKSKTGSYRPEKDW